MKKIKYIIVMITALCLTGCTTTSSVVLYFSVKNHTKNIATTISDLLDCDLCEIQPKKAYSDEDIDYNNDASRANTEQNDDSFRPEIKGKLSLDDYDIIYLGYPIWWG